MKYKHLFFDLDHTLWDFDANSRLTLEQLYRELELKSIGIDDFDAFHKNYLVHNERLWDRYRKGIIRVDELRWKRFYWALVDFQVTNEALSKQMAQMFLDNLPNRTILFLGTREVLRYLKEKGYILHLITNGFEEVQWGKLRNTQIDEFFTEVITSEGSNSLKPHKEIFDYALTRAKTVAPHSIMIGDDPEVDIKGAMNAGLDQVFVNHVNKTIDFVPTYTIHALDELKNIF